jgi:hypothetical protein
MDQGLNALAMITSFTRNRTLARAHHIMPVENLEAASVAGSLVSQGSTPGLPQGATAGSAPHQEEAQGGTSGAAPKSTSGMSAVHFVSAALEAIRSGGSGAIQAVSRRLKL